MSRHAPGPSSTVASPARARLHYAWIIAGVTFLTLVTAAGVRSAPGALMVPLQRDLHWSAEQISVAVSVSIVFYGLVGPFAAAMTDRIGLRRTMVLALSALALGVGLSSQVTQPWQLIALWGVIVGLGTGAAAMVLGAMVAARWFARRRGLVTGILTASTATGQLVFLPLIAHLAEHVGWRTATLTIAGAAIAIIPIVAILMRDRPRDVGLASYGANAEEAAAEARPVPPSGAISGLKDAVRHRDFWLLALGFFICGASTNGLIGTHFIAACVDHGMATVAAAGLLAAMGIFDFIGTTLSGWLSDRVDNRWLLFWYYGLRGLSLLFLPYAFDFSIYGLSLFALFYGLDWIATVPPTVKLAASTFGAERVGVMYGWIAASHQIGAGLTAWLAGSARTDLGSYYWAFITAGLLCMIAALASLMIGRKQRPAEPTEPAVMPA